MPLAVTETTPIPSPAARSSGDLLLPIDFVSQRPYRNLCWAACGSMVLQYYHVANSSLLEVASRVLGHDCTASPSGCDTAIWPETMYQSYNFSCDKAAGPLTPHSIRAFISALQPVQPYLQWADDEGNHTILIIGSYSNGDVYVLDPWWGVGRQSYQSVLYAYNRGTWQATWCNIRPSDAAVA